MPISKSVIVAQKLITDMYIESVGDIDLDQIASFHDIILQEIPLKNADGRIVFGKNKAIISINKDIDYDSKKRFTIAHELGHFFLHRNSIKIHNDNALTLDTFKNGSQETEANQFASELLMPTELFTLYANSKPFSPELLRDLAGIFQTSITSVAYKYQEVGNHPIFIFYCKDNRVQYWKPPTDFYIKVKDIKNLAPPTGSVASEFFDDGTVYFNEESKQIIDKSEWFELNYNEEDSDVCEYCIVTKKYNTTLSIVWVE